ncbi:stage II sporulation protein E [Abyssisolibacter fermentans]|uniref:stage II sporulation protein E n=1 Tax=Abyssisolibacter fermentans TaxID=1766203 RepID=UPI0008333357|nr:stage II sporulation protein E [Abyssisolibacter fermentans]
MVNEIVQNIKLKNINRDTARIEDIKNYLYISIPYFFITIICIFISRVKLMNNFMPFSIALVGAYMVKGKRNWLTGLSATIGLLTVTGMTKYEYIMAIWILLFLHNVFKTNIEFNKIGSALLSSFLIVFIRIVFLSIKDYFIYDFIMLSFEAVIIFAATYIFNYGISVFFKYDEDLINEEIISLVIILALVIAGVGQAQIYGFSLRSIISIFIIIAVGNMKGPSMGAAIGIAVGLIISFSTPFIYITVAILGFCGLMTGLFKELGKLASSISFIMSYFIISYYSIEAVDIVIKTREIIAGALMFLLLGKSFIEAFDRTILLNRNKLTVKKSYHNRIKYITKKRLMELSEVFEELSITFDRVIQGENYTQNKDISDFIDKISEGVCKNCSLYSICWKNDFYNTYKAMFDLMNMIEMKGNLKEKNLPLLIRKRCLRPNKIVDKCNYLFDLYKLNYVWNKKIQESRQLVSQQLKGVSNIMVDLSQEIEEDIRFKEDVENSIYIQLKNNEIAVTEVVVTESSSEKFEIIVETKNKLDNSQVQKLIKIVSSIVGYKIKMDKYFYGSSQNNKYSKIKLIKANRFNAITKVSRVNNSFAKVSGDSYVFGERKNNYFTILSDGMGVGYKANIESSTVVSLLEKFLEAGYNKEVALKTINSILILKSNDEMLTTLDMSILDLYTGKGQFVKIGSAPTYIKRNKTIISINSSSLPIGILKEVDIYVYEEQIKNGDIIIMLSDGVLDANEDSQDKEAWLTEIIRNIDSVNPQTVADKIMDSALKIAPIKNRDDMTILATKIWKSVK